MGIQDEEIDTTLKVLSKFREASSEQIVNLEHHIEKLEKTVAKPYVKNKQRPY